MSKDKIKKGYLLESFKDAFKRYVPPTPPVLSATAKQVNNISIIRRHSSATQYCFVAFEKQPNHLKLNDCCPVADITPPPGEDTPFKHEVFI